MKYLIALLLFGTQFLVSSLEASQPPMRVLKVVNFELSTPMQYVWEKEKPAISQGSVLTVAAPVDYVRPKQSAENIFYVDGRVAERVKVLSDSKIILFVPQKVDLKTSVLVVGAPALPEQLDIEKRQQGFQKAMSDVSAHKTSMPQSAVKTVAFKSLNELYNYDWK